ncbi:hypothetical protein GOP47_0003014 [Adiantum capillus-veneris]|uniref:PPM-type phosphatase domain-containing protein n=1 Tax=Adiantum capillus-veneris TaxID=13818 RepID=A0A9D4VCQ4_ADICA|nr:hypothetical protein GOP47_0003014 [Adiantum capillus-veneris]
MSIIFTETSNRTSIANAVDQTLLPLHGLQSSPMLRVSPCIRSGVWFDRGSRINMEDEHVVIDNLQEYPGSHTEGSFYGVFDGHEGRSAAEFVRDKLLSFLLQNAAFPFSVEKALHNAFLETDAAFAEACSLDEGLSSGTTALTVLVLGREVFVANAGDCRAILCRKGKPKEMSRDHKPDVERARIEALGGFIDDGYLNGQLSVARALGNWHIEGLKGVNGPLIADPEVQHLSLTDDDEFMIIGCDGFWDVFTNEEAVTFARRRLQQHNDPTDCSRELVDEALRRNTTDNLTVLTVTTILRFFGECSEAHFFEDDFTYLGCGRIALDSNKGIKGYIDEAKSYVLCKNSLMDGELIAGCLNYVSLVATVRLYEQIAMDILFLLEEKKCKTLPIMSERCGMARSQNWRGEERHNCRVMQENPIIP